LLKTPFTTISRGTEWFINKKFERKDKGEAVVALDPLYGGGYDCPLAWRPWS